MKKLIIPALLIVIIALLAAISSVQRAATNDRVEGDHVMRHTNQVALGAEHAQRGIFRRERSRILEEERKAALDLAGRMAENVFTPPRMLFNGEEHLPSALVEEAAGMKVTQLRVLVRELGENLEIAGTDRALLVTIVMGAWLKEHEHEAGRARSLEQMLEIIAEVLPALPPGHDTLPVSTAMGRSLDWDLPLWVDFMEAHWSRWSGSNGNPNAEIMRRDLLGSLDDPELRRRVENLPQAGVRIKK